MKTVILDAAKLDGMRGVHEIFRDTLGFPDYYGYNLDALYDCLTDLHEDTELRVVHGKALEERLGLYVGVLRRMLGDACEENPRLRLVWEE